MNEYGYHPAFAWPTFDGELFVPWPDDGARFFYDNVLNAQVAEQIEKGHYADAKGFPAGIRHLSYQLSRVLFPMNE